MRQSGTQRAITGPLAGLPLLEDLPDPSGRKVLVRVDFNVPLRQPNGGVGTAEVVDDFRIRAALPTIQWLVDHGAAVTTCTHVGRPKGLVDHRYDVTPIAARLAELAPGVELMENLRFNPGEEGNDPAFARQLADGFDLFVNDAFGTCHRAHASVMGPPSLLPSAAGRLLAREVKILGNLLTGPSRPFVAVVGGAKVADKLGVLRSLLGRVDRLLIGGGMAFTFLAAEGHDVGASLVDPAWIDDCRDLLAIYRDQILLPSDVVALAPGYAMGPGCIGGEVQVVGTDVPDGWQGLDIGPETACAYAEAIQEAATLLWNGPMGVFEDARFQAGTATVASAVASCPGFTVIGGGDSAAAMDHFGLADKVGFVSTGGGATLELLQYGDLPGLSALRESSNAPSVGTATY